MSIEVEYRVRPVQRFVVTHWYSETNADGTHNGGCESLGEFDNAAQAAKVVEAMRNAAQVKLEPSLYAVVQRVKFDLNSMVYYAHSLAEARAAKDDLEAKYGGEFSVFAPVDETA